MFIYALFPVYLYYFLYKSFAQVIILLVQCSQSMPSLHDIYTYFGFHLNSVVLSIRRTAMGSTEYRKLFTMRPFWHQNRQNTLKYAELQFIFDRKIIKDLLIAKMKMNMRWSTLEIFVNLCIFCGLLYAEKYAEIHRNTLKKYNDILTQ